MAVTTAKEIMQTQKRTVSIIQGGLLRREPISSLSIVRVGEDSLSLQGTFYNGFILDNYVGHVKLWRFEPESVPFPEFIYDGAKIPAVYISHLNVKSEFTERGIGTQLLAFGEQLALREGMRYALLHSDNDINPGLTDFYRRRGYELVRYDISSLNRGCFEKDFFRKEL